MPASYRYIVRSIHGASKLESELLTLSREAWEPINLQRDAAGNYEVVLRQPLDETIRVAVEQPVDTSIVATPLFRFAVRSIHGATKLEAELSNLSIEGWEPLSFQRDGAGTYDVVFRGNQDGSALTTIYQYRLRSVHSAPKLESELMNLSSDGWEPLDIQADAAATYHVILRRLLDGQLGVEPLHSEESLNAAPPYRYAVRHVHGAAKLESELTNLSSESWEPITFLRDAAGMYELILRQKT